MEADQSPFRVLFVCTGNICRSRIAEQAFRGRFSNEDVEFSSAGVGALVGMGMPPQAGAVSKGLGGVSDGRVARALTRDLIADADLVVAMSREHRSDVVRMLPRASRSTFTLRELARLLESLVLDTDVGPRTGTSTSDTLRSSVARVAARRGYADQPSHPEDDDVIDPFRRSQETYDLCGAQIGDAITRTISSISILAERWR